MAAEPAEPDPSLRRIQRDSAIIALAAAGLALALQRGRLSGALGVVAGAALMAFSFRAIRGGVDAAVRKASARGEVSPGPPVPKGRVPWALIRFIGRYLIIAVAAWAVLVLLRAHPVGLFAGVSAPVAAIGIEAIRLVRAKSEAGQTGRQAH